MCGKTQDMKAKYENLLFKININVKSNELVSFFDLG